MTKDEDDTDTQAHRKPARPLKKLPQERRDLALAAYSRDTSIRELATQLGRTEGALYQLLSRIRMQLFDCINRSLEHSL